MSDPQILSIIRILFCLVLKHSNLIPPIHLKLIVNTVKAKKRGPLAPPKPPPKTAFSGMDLIQGPNAMFQKFTQASNPDAPLV